MVNITTKAMVSTERYPKTNNDWEDLSKTERTWPKWKTMYRDANNKAKVKKKACDAQFGGLANNTALAAPTEGGSQWFSIAQLCNLSVELKRQSICLLAYTNTISNTAM